MALRYYINSFMPVPAISAQITLLIPLWPNNFSKIRKAVSKKGVMLFETKPTVLLQIVFECILNHKVILRYHQSRHICLGDP